MAHIDWLQKLGPQEMERVLVEQREVRIGFAAGEERYLIPLGYVWLDAAVCGATPRGRKTRLAQVDPRVSFQVDTSATTGHYTWEGITGQGIFEVLEESDPIIERLDQLLAQRFADAPEWLMDSVAKETAAGEMVYWRIRPSAMTGVRAAPPTR